MSCYGGWVSPNGEFIEVDEYGHRNAALNILGRAPIHYPVYTVMFRLGYVRILYDFFECDGSCGTYEEGYCSCEQSGEWSAEYSNNTPAKVMREWVKPAGYSYKDVRGNWRPGSSYPKRARNRSKQINPTL